MARADGSKYYYTIEPLPPVLWREILSETRIRAVEHFNNALLLQLQQQIKSQLKYQNQKVNRFKQQIVICVFNSVIFHFHLHLAEHVKEFSS